jgi:hypothetical protein
MYRYPPLKYRIGKEKYSGLSYLVSIVSGKSIETNDGHKQRTYNARRLVLSYLLSL